MKKNAIFARMAVVFSKKELERISVWEGGSEVEIIADLHMMRKEEARRFVKNIIALVRGAFRLLLIHGYNHGTVLKDMIREGGIGSARVLGIIPEARNEGATVLAVAADPARTGYMAAA